MAPRLIPAPAIVRPTRIAGPTTAYPGGMYNPGAWTDGRDTRVLLRAEPAFPAQGPAAVVLGQWDGAALRDPLVPLRIVDAPAGARVEDARPIAVDGVTYVVHTLVPADGLRPGVRTHGIQPWLSVLEADGLRVIEPITLPRLLTPVEKNWVGFVHAGRLHLVYSLDPLIIYRAAGDRWSLVRHAPTGWARALGKAPRNSAHLLPYAGGYLGWWHLIFDRSYVTGAYWLDTALQLRARTGILFDGQQVEDGHKPGVLYLSSVIDAGDGTWRLFFGEGDAYASTLAVGQDWVAGRLSRGEPVV